MLTFLKDPAFCPQAISSGCSRKIQAVLLPNGGKQRRNNALLYALDKERILRALKQAKGNKKLAAKMLGIGRSTLYNKLDEYGLNEEN